MARDPQPCSTPGCVNAAAFRTRIKPAWCDTHVTEILRTGGLEPLEPFTSPTAWRLTRCLSCGCEAHYRFEYTLGQNSIGIATCRACFWRSWAGDARRMQGAWADTRTVTHEEAQSKADANGYDYLGPLTDPSLPDDPHRVRCRYCHRISASRLGDVGWGCTCQTNPRRAAQTSRVVGSTKRDLLKDSGLAAVRWWDHEQNDEALLSVVTTRATRSARWRCPDCLLRFSARIIDMTSVPQCPDCELKWRAKRNAELREERARLAVTSVADVPELLNAWADDADPTTVMLGADGQLRRFECVAGHHPRLTPLSFLRGGCPSCRGNETRTTRLEEVALDPTAHQMNREISAQWHPTRNGRTKRETLSPGSRRKVWWREESCGHEWEMSPADREKGQRLRCPGQVPRRGVRG